MGSSISSDDEMLIEVALQCDVTVLHAEVRERHPHYRLNVSFSDANKAPDFITYQGRRFAKMRRIETADKSYVAYFAR